jgi:hypothetical protein
MKTYRAPVLLFAAVLLGATVESCTSPSSGGPSQGSGGATPNGSSGATGLGGDAGSGGSGTSGEPADEGGDTGTGGAPSTDGNDGSGGDVGSGGVSPIGGNFGSDGGAASGGSTGSGGSGSGGATGASGGGTPCGILAGAGNPCAAAHSTVRVIFPGYAGPLYQVCKGSFAPGPSSCPGGMTKDIGSVAGGYADSASQDEFCSGGTCTISIIYDQSPMKNDLNPAPAGGAKRTPDNPANATDLKTTLNGHVVYGVFIKTGMGYRAGCTACGVVSPKGTAYRRPGRDRINGDQPEGADRPLLLRLWQRGNEFQRRR